jgi:hypothetical protein
MRSLKWAPACVCLVLAGFCLTCPMAAQLLNAQPQPVPASSSYWSDPVNWQQQFVPDSFLFWDNSKHWPTNYGPSYRDVTVDPRQMLACSGQFALCFHSGPEPYPCTLSPDGRSADCKCMVMNSTNYVLITSILNYPVYLATVNACTSNGSGCNASNPAPVCKYLPGGALIPGADLISTYDPQTHEDVARAIRRQIPVTTCDKGPFAACMTAPCQVSPGSSTATCKCPVFNGRFTLAGAQAQCSLGGNLVPSASYIPALDPKPNQ